MRKTTRHSARVPSFLDAQFPRFQIPPGAWGLMGLGLASCAERLPEDVRNYQSDCLLMTEGIAEVPDDPHRGTKNVYACNASYDELRANARPFADGVIMVKEATRADADFVWLVSTARKIDGGWQWDEYTRNFDDEDFVHIISGEGACIDCHRDVSIPAFDWIFSRCNVPECLGTAE